MEKEWNARWLLISALLCSSLLAASQRTYTEKSVLASGNWFKLSTSGPGVYKVDLPFLAGLGVSTANLQSSAIRLFGNGGGMLPEQAAVPVFDDLVENAILVVDGGDGVLNGSDYFLFYAEGPHKWRADTAARTFHHHHNIYSNESFYYLTINGEGIRIPVASTPAAFNAEVAHYQHLYYHELDTFNLLSSGKQWFGEEFSAGPGKTLSRLFPLTPVPAVQSSPFNLRLKTVARAFASNSRFTVSIGGASIMEQQIPPVATGPYDVFAREGFSQAGSILTATPTLRIDFQPGSDNAQGWLDWFEVITTAPLQFYNAQFSFRNWNITGSNAVRFNILANDADLKVWDVSNPLLPKFISLQNTAGLFFFNYDCSELKQFQAFSTSTAYKPVAIGRVSNQDLHQAVESGYLIVSHPTLFAESQRLAEFHRVNNGLKVTTVTTEQVYNEFSSGTPDPTAIRNYVKMFFDRAGGDSAKFPKYLLLFGDGSFDYKQRITGNTNLVPVYESNNSLEPLATYTSDDFFGMVQDNADINSPTPSLLSLGIGRIPAKNHQEARAFVDKLIAYHSPPALGPWRNEMTLVADDEDNNLHLEDAESVASSIRTKAPQSNLEKLYFDLFPQQSSAGGSIYPELNQQIQNRFFSGTLIWNYSGHGGYRRLAEETILDASIINQIKNEYRLPLFITATCDVAPYDNPLIQSMGENLVLMPKTGAIALMTTTRLVFAFSNRVMNNNYLQMALTRKPDGAFPSLGEAIKAAKNYTYQFSGDVINNRKFTLLGDPAMTLAFPKQTVRINSINGRPTSAVPDTLKALSRYIIGGDIIDISGSPVGDFNGTIYAAIQDKPQTISTLANDPGSIKVGVEVQRNHLFKGKGKVTGGVFSVEFIVPKDIDYRFGNGKISLYAENGQTDGAGHTREIIVGGTGNTIDDTDGPEIQAYLNDERFVSGGITNESPILLLKLKDSSGINIMGTGIGHDLVAYLDNYPSKPFVLNEYYESELDDFRQGVVRYQLPVLTEGPHTLTIKAWDIANNSSEAAIDFRIANSNNLILKNVLNYPNPFTTRTNFWFEHNHPGEELRVTVQVYTVTGKLVKTLRSTIITDGNRSFEVEWDGRDEYGSKIGRGVYIYNLKVQTSDGKTAQKLEKLYKL